ncbi:MAG: ABC transporter permease [Clostridium sp.]|nr:ABC transporter permease [Clostridium sp.]MCM1444706.1 ABC transporter permease [Candidatus Amulumruptor caecigallinarius]
MAFSDLEDNQKLNIINLAIVESDDFNNNEIYINAFKTLSDPQNEDRLFNISYVNLDEAENLLKDNSVIGYITFNNDDINITVKSSGIYETILRNIVDKIMSNNILLHTLSIKEIDKQLEQENYTIDHEKIKNDILDLIQTDMVNLNDISNKNMNYTMIEYYTLIALSCLYSGILSMVVTNYKLASSSSVGKRTFVSPESKVKSLLGSLSASYVLGLIGVLILFIFTLLVLKVDYGTNLIIPILFIFLAVFAGLTFGITISTLIKANETVKIGILIAITMLFCFLSGMMGITMKYVIDKNIPLLNKINPCAIITDAFYSLYYYIR